MFAAGIAGATDTAVAIVPAIALPAAGVVFAAGRLAFKERYWQSWLGLALASVPALFWVAFVIAEIMGPKH
jgi:4-amino-4-deoxy-L-arabinose transferase-like glycosyltransferase